MKKSLNEHINRIKYLTNYSGKNRVTESFEIEEQDAQIDPNFEREMQTALSQIMRDLPNELNQVARTAGDKDGQLELPGTQNAAPQQQQPVQQVQQTQQVNQQQVQNEAELNEAIGMMAAGGILALPKISNMVGKAAQFLGKKVDSSKLQNFGAMAIKFGDKMHHQYDHIIDTILSPLTKNMTPDQRKTANKLVFYAIVATFLGVGATGAIGAASAGKAGLAAGEGILSSVKATELVQAAKEVIPRVLSTVIS